MPKYIENYVPAVKLSRGIYSKYALNAYKGVPTGSNPQASINPAIVVNTTSITQVDSNNQGTASGIVVTTNGNGSEVGLSIQNRNPGALASSDIVINGDTATDILSGPFLDIGVTSAAGNNPLYTVLPVGAYLFTVGLAIGMGTSGAQDVIFHTNGTLIANEKLRIKSTGPILVQNQTAVAAGGATTSYIGVSSTAGLGVYWGSGVPTVTAAQGSLYIRTDGSSTSTRLYVNTTGSTTWTNVTTAA